MTRHALRCAGFLRSVSPPLLSTTVALLVLLAPALRAQQAMYRGVFTEYRVKEYTDLFYCDHARDIEDSSAYILPAGRHSITIDMSGARSCPYGSFTGLLAFSAPVSPVTGALSAKADVCTLDAPTDAFTVQLTATARLLTPVASPDSVMDADVMTFVVDSRGSQSGRSNCPGGFDFQRHSMYAPDSHGFSSSASCQAVGMTIDEASKTYDKGVLIGFSAWVGISGIVRLSMEPDFTTSEGNRSSMHAFAVYAYFTFTSADVALAAEFDPPEIKCGESAALTLSVKDSKGNVMTGFDGGATIEVLAAESTPDITRMQAVQSVLLTKGKSQPVFAFTPKIPYDAATPITDNTVLSGKLVVKVTLEGSGLAPVTRTLPVRSPFDFSIDRIEIDQGIADADKTVTLEYKPGQNRDFAPLPFIADHDANVRVFPKFTATTVIPYSTLALNGFTVTLVVLRDGVERSRTTLSNGGSDVFTLRDSYTDEQHLALNDAFYRRVPPVDLSGAGTYSLEAAIVPPAHITEIAAEQANNRTSVDYTFAGTKSLPLLAMRGARQGQPLPDAQLGSWDALRLLFPVQGSKLLYGRPNDLSYVFQGGVFTDVRFGTLERFLTQWNKNNPADPKKFIIMFAPADVYQSYWLCGDNTGGCALGTACIVGPGDLMAGAHEIGHLLGLTDTYISSFYSTRNGDPNPRRNGATNDGNWIEAGGINLLGSPPRLEGPIPRTHEFMGGLRNSWVDRVTWDYLYRQRLAIGAPGFAPETPPADSYLAITGEVTRSDSAYFDPFVLMSEIPVAPDTATGVYAIVFADKGAAPLSRWNFPVSFHIPDGGDRNRVTFSLRLPLPPGTASVSLLRRDEASGKDKTLATRTFSTNPPAVRILAPKGGPLLSGNVTLRWTASDPDGDTLSYDILFSPDGKEQRVVAVLLRDTSFTIDTRNLASSSSAYFTVIANDGVNEGRAESDRFVVTDAEERDLIRALPGTPALDANFPNPFAARTTLRFAVPRQGHVRLTVTDMLGRTVAVLADKEQAPGNFSLTFDASALPAGAYLVTLEACGQRVTRTILRGADAAR